MQIVTFWCGSDRMPVDSELSPERRISRDSRGQRSSRSAIGVFEGERTERRLGAPARVMDWSRRMQ